jgi:hypothetical protein
MGASTTDRDPMPPRPASPLPVVQSGPAPPSFPLIGAHFAAGFAWVLLGGIALIVLAPVLAQGTFLDPRLLGTTHLFTLGWITTIITGVLYQIFPAMLGVGARSMGVAALSLVLQTLGVGLLAAGLLTGRGVVQTAGWLALFLAVFGTAWNLLPQRRRAPRNRQLRVYVSYAHMSFGFAMAIGGARIGDALGWWTTPRLGLLAAHFHFAAAGFASMTAFGLGGRMIPMFLGAAEASAPELRWLPRVLGTGTVVFAVGAMFGQPTASWLGAGLMAGATAAFLGLAARWYRGRGRPTLDPTTGLLLAALVWLTLAIPFGLAALIRGPLPPGVIVGYVVIVLLGWLTGLILGVSFRVLPTLIWHYRLARRSGRPGLPGLGEMVLPGLGWAALALHTAGVMLLVIGVTRTSSTLAMAGALLFTGAIAITGIHHLRLFFIGGV